jgi:hypothetical protein
MSSALPRIDRAVVLAAAERHEPRVKADDETSTRLTTAYRYEDFDGGHNLRREFRRMINPGIMQNNDHPVALQALEVTLVMPLVP